MTVGDILLILCGKWIPPPIYVATALSACGPLSVDAQQPKGSQNTQQDAGQAKRQHPAQSAAAQAGDPTAPLLQMQFTETFVPCNHNADGFSNLFNFEPVLTVAPPKKFHFAQTLRLTVPVITPLNLLPSDQQGKGYTWVIFGCKYPGLVGHFWIQINNHPSPRLGGIRQPSRL